MRSYDYGKREGTEEISWERFARLVSEIAERLAGANADAVVGIARAGLLPATAVACALRLDLFPIAMSRRESDRVVHEKPVWKAAIPDAVRGRKIALVDEITDSGETLRTARDALREAGAASVVTACLVSHTWADPPPDVAALVTDALVLFPWDRRVFQQGEWRPHPELEEALRLQSERRRDTERNDES